MRPTFDPYGNQVVAFTVAQNSTTGMVDTRSYDIYGLDIPTIDSATVTIQGSVDGIAWKNIKDGQGTQVLVSSATTGGYMISSVDMAHAAAYPFIRVLLGASQSTAAVVFNLVLKGIRR